LNQLATCRASSQRATGIKHLAENSRVVAGPVTESKNSWGILENEMVTEP